MPKFTIGVDVGGTFTDYVVLDSEGKSTIGKVLSTPQDFSIGILNALEDAALSLDLNSENLLHETSILLHSTTVAENALINNDLTTAGLITTFGFEDILRMTRGAYGRWSGLTEDSIKHMVFTNKPPPIVPQALIESVKERTNSLGQILAEVDDSEVRTVATKLRQSGANAFGVCLLWSFMNPTNENRIGKILREMYPGALVSLSNELAPVLGEYERISTVALNASLSTQIAKYLDNLRTELSARRFEGVLYVMLGYGGLVPVGQASARSVELIECGPAGGLIGSQFLCDKLEIKNAIVCDLGGTSFKVGMITNSAIEYAPQPSILRYHYATPKLDIVTISAGGGSILWIDQNSGLPKVGPRSAGSLPGPVCYDLGGEEPTVADVDVILGYIDPVRFLGGKMKLNKEKALSNFEQKIAKPLGLDAYRAASSYYRVINSQMSDLLRKVTIERGLDPRDYVIFSIGGAASTHVGIFAGELGIKNIVVPFCGSVQGAFGLVSSDIVHEYAVTKSVPIPSDPKQIDEIFNQLNQKAVAQLESEGFREENIKPVRSVGIRFRSQVHKLTTPVRAMGPLKNADLENVYREFETIYEQKHGKGSAFKEAGMEFVEFRLRASCKLPRPELKAFDKSTHTKTSQQALIDRRLAYCDKTDEMTPTDIYDFELMPPDIRIQGPSVLLTPITTVVIGKNQAASVDKYKNILIRESV